MVTEIIVDIRGELGTAKNLENASAEIVAAVSRGLLKGALLVEADAKKASPVDTGRLRSSIVGRTIPNDPLTFIVGTNVEYSEFVEFGTRHMKPQPYLIPSALSNSSNIVQLVKTEIEAIKG